MDNAASLPMNFLHIQHIHDAGWQAQNNPLAFTTLQGLGTIKSFDLKQILTL
jgi:hypothetical protein